MTDAHPPQILTTFNNEETYVECDICGKRSLYTELRPTLEREGSFTCEFVRWSFYGFETFFSLIVTS